MKTVAVILSGCGVYDGSEINEAVLTLLALERAGASVRCYAPDIAQHHVVNHGSGSPSEGESRRVLDEAARITRGRIEALDALDPTTVDALVFVGGYGAAKNLCTLAFDGADYTVDPAVADCVKRAHEAGKALGFMCIAPAIAAAVLGPEGVELTIGTDPDTAGALESKGAKHVDCPVDGAVVDDRLKVVTTPAYMLAENLLEAEKGINKLVEAVLEIA